MCRAQDEDPLGGMEQGEIEGGFFSSFFRCCVWCITERVKWMLCITKGVALWR